MIRFSISNTYLRNLTAVLLVIALSFSVTALHAQKTDRMSPENLWKISRVSGGVLSPDGQWMVYGLTDYDIEENKGESDLYLTHLEDGTTRQLTDLEGREFNPQWHPGGKKIGFLATKGESSQLWEISVAEEDAEPQQVTEFDKSIHNFRYSPKAEHISFTQSVKLDSTVNDLYPDLPKANARLFNDLMYRHWDSWHDYAYSHLFIATYDEGEVGDPRDLMKGEKYNTPLQPFGGLSHINWHPDGDQIAYTSKKLTGAEYSKSTNSGIYLYDLDSGETALMTEGMEGFDREPVFSPNGRYMAWLSMRRDGYESDKNRLFIHDFKKDKKIEVTVDFNADAHNPVWAEDNRTIYMTSEWKGEIHVFKTDIRKKKVEQLTDGMYNYGALNYANGNLIAMRENMATPEALYQVDTKKGDARQLTFANKELLDQIKEPEVEKRWIETTDGKEMLTWVIYPPDFDPEKQYPALLYLQGGPQSTVSQFFSYRWNFNLMAANDYIIVAPNRRGVPSFGQEWKEAISKDWGGQAIDDYLSAIDAVKKEDFVDEDRLGAIGASFGGYSAFYLAGHHEDRFKTFVAHAGVFNLESMYGSTEERSFVNFDLGGPYWQQPTPESYEKFSPHDYVQNWDTPMLIIHGQKDFRVPVTQGFEAFTALRAQGIDSKFLYYPEEGHWILSPQNGILWHRVFFDWLDGYLK